MSPRWRADGRRLFFSGDEGKLMAVDVDMTRGFEAAVPLPLFGADYQDYVVAPNAQRFIASTRVRQGAGSARRRARLDRRPDAAGPLAALPAPGLV